MIDYLDYVAVYSLGAVLGFIIGVLLTRWIYVSGPVAERCERVKLEDVGYNHDGSRPWLPLPPERVTECQGCATPFAALDPPGLDRFYDFPTNRYLCSRCAAACVPELRLRVTS